MKTHKKIILIKVLLLLILFLLGTHEIFAVEMEKVEYTDEFKQWLELPEEEKQKVMMPRMYSVESSEIEYKNPLFLTRMLGSSLSSKYSLKDTIPNNISIRNQQETNSCWAFAALSSLETNIALSNYKNNTNTSKVYDFSERHMEYATSRLFANNEVNPNGLNRKVGEGGNLFVVENYLLNGYGAIPESEMPFENNENLINLNEIKNKTVSSQVYDTIRFESYSYKEGEKRTNIINQIKQHIKNYGSVFAQIHGAAANGNLYTCYNNDTGAKYCSSSIVHPQDHAVSIIGWDDNYSVDNFAEDARPSANGAWIARNSWGERLEFNLLELKQEIYNSNKYACDSNGWTEPNLIPNEIVEENGYTIEGDMAYYKIGDNGIMYISYEDVNVGDNAWGIIKATDTVDYDHIYSYNELVEVAQLEYMTSKVMLANIFNKGSSTEYLTQVSLYAPEQYTCRVFVNPKGSSFSKTDLQLVPLKAGESETIDVGYHTLEFSKPVELTSDKFAVVIEITVSDYSTSISLEAKNENLDITDTVTIQSGKCFITPSHNLDECEWIDLSKLTELNDTLINGDSTIKAFTTDKLVKDSLNNIKITTPPTKKSYFEGENFDATGMVVTAYFNNNTSKVLDSSSYSISNGTNLKAGQTSVTIIYKDKSVQQTITVEKNVVTELKIKTPPTKTEYKEGQNFDKTGMVVEATRKNGSKQTVTDYTITDGNNLKADQTKVTISYEGKTVTQKITVTPNPLVEIKVDKAPSKTNYVVGQDFDKTGMVIVGVYQDKSTVEIKDYKIENGNKLTKGQTSVTISYLGKTTTQKITVVEKTITGISINKMPNKLTYIQNKEDLDLTGGSIKVNYNDGTSEIVDMKSKEISVTGFDNKKVGKITLTVTYSSKTTKFELEIIAEEHAVNSKLENANCDVKGIKAYLFTNNTQKDYTLIDVEINNIERNLKNDKVEYYYYLSTNNKEENITKWTKITEEQSSNDKLSFKIDSRNVLNYDEISLENVLYIYIKEVAIKGGDQSVETSKALSVECDVKVETYVDNVKKDNLNTNNNNNNNNNKPTPPKDNTISSDKLPAAGTTVTVFLSIIIALAVGIILYCKYRKLSKYVK